jgi:hypothetical protein
MTQPTEQSIIAFLNGEGPLDGKHFGDRDERGRAFWWRKYLPSLARRIEAEAEAVACAGCEGKPAPENSPCTVCGLTAPPTQPDQSARIAELEAALRRQGGNMAFALNNFEMPYQWYSKFARELEEARQALKGSTDEPA